MRDGGDHAGYAGHAIAIVAIAASVGPLEVEILQIRSSRLQLLRCKEARAHQSTSRTSHEL